MLTRLALPKRRRGASDDGRDVLADAAREIEAQAVAVDQDLVLAAHARGPATAELRARIDAQVDELEALAARVSAAASALVPRRPGAAPTEAGLAALQGRLDALDAARAEIARLEASVGLGPGGPFG